VELNMSEYLSIPFPRALYDDLVRLSDGRCDPVWLAQSKIETWIDYNLQSNFDGRGFPDDDFARYFEERADELAEKYAPEVFESWKSLGQELIASAIADRQPLTWKEISVPAGSEVRMTYGGMVHFARVMRGRVHDDDGDFTPSQWAAKVAGHARNAWRDVWFKRPGATHWELAELLRRRSREHATS
jgi:hypothetical protein